jgi:hypothetical protein
MEKRKARNAYRIGTNQWMPDSCFNRLMQLLRKHPGSADELIFFTSETHPPLKLEDVKAFSPLLAERIKTAKAAGFTAGVNVLATMGHHDENLENSLDIPAARATDPEGRVCRGSFCLNDPLFLNYVEELYRIVAETRPDFIYIDDDVRLRGHMPIESTCFCDRCLEIFERETGIFSSNGMAVSRENIRLLFNNNDLTLRDSARRAWLSHNRAGIKRLFELIEKTVHTVDPKLMLGFMTGERFYEGFDFDTWAYALKGSAGEVRWRPGGGFYTDSRPDDGFEKANQIGRQCAYLPEFVNIIQSEIENFPYQMLSKSVRVTMYEAALHIAAGCTGAAFNVLPMDYEPISEHEAFFKAAEKMRPFFDALADAFGTEKPVGVGPMWDKNTAVSLRTSDNWPAKLDTGINEAVWHTGIPIAYHEDNCLVYTLCGGSAADLSDEQIKKILSRGVYMDTAALDALNARGYSEYTGFATEKYLPVDVIEKYTRHPLNSGLEGRERDCRQSFWHFSAACLEPTAPGAQTLAVYTDYTRKTIHGCGMGIYINSLGGRVCVAGYFPYTLIFSSAKTAQLKNIFRWLSDEKLPAYVLSFDKMAVWGRKSRYGSPGAVLANLSLDEAERPKLALLAEPSASVCFVDFQARRSILTPEKREGRYNIYALPPIGPLEVCFAVAE